MSSIRAVTATGALSRVSRVSVISRFFSSCSHSSFSSSSSSSFSSPPRSSFGCFSLPSRSLFTRSFPSGSDFDPKSSFSNESQPGDSNSSPSSSDSPAASGSASQSESASTSPSTSTSSSAISESSPASGSTRPPHRRISAPVQPPIVYGHLKLHKTKAALDVSFVKPMIARFGPARLNQWQLKKPGSLKIDFAPSRVGDNGFDWKNKITLQLNILEVGTLLAFNANPQATEAKFFHDPNLGTEDAGSVTKELKIIRQGIARGFYFNVTQTDGDRNRTAINIPITDSEFAILVTLCQHSLPYLLCMQTIEPLKVEQTNTPSKNSSNYSDKTKNSQ